MMTAVLALPHVGCDPPFAVAKHYCLRIAVLGMDVPGVEVCLECRRGCKQIEIFGFVI